MDTTTNTASEKIMDRVRDLLAIAEHPGTPAHEADTALNMANRLITKHAIDEAILRMDQTEEQRRAPEKRTIKMSGLSYTVAPALRTILVDIAEANRCSVALEWDAEVYGAAEDVSWVEMLFMSVSYELVSKINPKWDTDKSYDENVYNFKVAGFKWVEINNYSVINGGPDARVFEENFAGRMVPTGKIKGSMIGAYKRHAKLVGDTNPVATQSHQVYKLSFIEGFKRRLVNRIRDLARDARSEADTIPGAALALSSMAEEIKSMFYSEHPDLDPEEQRRQREKARQDRADMLNAMTPTQRAKFLEKEERDSRRRQKGIRYYDLDDSAAGRGRSAAESVNLNRSKGRTEAAAERGALGK